MIGRLKNVIMDARDVVGLARFWRELAGWTELYVGDTWAAFDAGDGWTVSIQGVPEHVPPRWPDPAHPQQAHLDLRVADVEAATARAQELGATLLRRNERWHTLADPAGHPFDLCVGGEGSRYSLLGVTLDCPDAAALAAFYAELLGKPVTHQGDGFAMIGEEGAQAILFQQVEDYVAPRWPDPAYPQQFHLDVLVDDIEAAEKAVLALGATRLPGEGDHWRVYADPAGKPFCLSWKSRR